MTKHFHSENLRNFLNIEMEVWKGNLCSNLHTGLPLFSIHIYSTYFTPGISRPVYHKKQ